MAYFPSQIVFSDVSLIHQATPNILKATNYKTHIYSLAEKNYRLRFQEMRRKIVLTFFSNIFEIKKKFLVDLKLSKKTIYVYLLS